uniref:Uncharacterized protein n=1 Tax=Triticum urartu TaxID=4572 RepID=A0A8R7UNW3_TRIUA
HPDKENAQLRATAGAGAAVPVRADHVERLRVLAPGDPVEPRAHVRHLAVRVRRPAGRLVHHVPGQHAGAHRHGAQQLHDREVAVRGLPPDRVPDAPAVDVGRPHRLLQQADAPAAFAGVGRLLGL